MNFLSDFLGSKSRAEIFRLLFERAGTELYLRELHRRSGLSIRPIQQELDRLEKFGMVKIRKDGNRRYYSANNEHPLYPEIRSLVVKTSGVVGALREALSDPAVQMAFIFGSVASGEARPDSDLDLFVIGEAGSRKVSGLLRGMTDRVGRLVNPYVLTVGEFARRVQAKHPFVSTVMDSKKMFVIGDERDLGRMAKR